MKSSLLSSRLKKKRKTGSTLKREAPEETWSQHWVAPCEAMRRFRPVRLLHTRGKVMATTKWRETYRQLRLGM